MRKPYLLQRCTTEKLHKFDPSLVTGKYLRLDYMGSSEFEWGAIPQFQRDLYNRLIDMKHYRVIHKGITLFFWCDNLDKVSIYSQFIRDLIDKKTQTKERVGFDAKETLYVGKNKTALFNAPHAPYEHDVWFDLTNTTIIARHVDVLDNLRKTIGNSIRYMDNQKRKSK